MCRRSRPRPSCHLSRQLPKCLSSSTRSSSWRTAWSSSTVPLQTSRCTCTRSASSFLATWISRTSPCILRRHLRLQQRCTSRPALRSCLVGRAVLLVTSRWAFILSVPPESPAAASFSHVIDLAAAGSPLAAELAFAPVPAKKAASSSEWGYTDPPQLVQCAALWEGPGPRALEREAGGGAAAAECETPILHLLLGSKGRVGEWRTGRAPIAGCTGSRLLPRHPALQLSSRSCQAWRPSRSRPHASSPCTTSCGSATSTRARGSTTWPCGAGRSARATRS